MNIKKQVIRVELEEGFVSQIQEACNKEGIDLDKMAERAFERELKYIKNKNSQKTSKKP